MTSASTVTKVIIQTTLPLFVSIVGDFFNSTWYDYPVISTTGAKNRIGSTRLIHDTDDNLFYNETLVKYTSRKSFFKEAWTGPNEPVKSLNYGTFLLGSYLEYISGETVCDDFAVRVTFGIDFCTTNVDAAKKSFDDAHIDGIKHIKTLLKIQDFTTCAAAMKPK